MFETEEAQSNRASTDRAKGAMVYSLGLLACLLLLLPLPSEVFVFLGVALWLLLLL
jgi:hypothetical protein